MFIKGYGRSRPPTGASSLCANCTHAHIMTGFGDSEKITICNQVSPNVVIPFLIHECTGYFDKHPHVAAQWSGQRPM